MERGGSHMVLVVERRDGANGEQFPRTEKSRYEHIKAVIRFSPGCSVKV